MSTNTINGDKVQTSRELTINYHITFVRVCTRSGKTFVRSPTAQKCLQSLQGPHRGSGVAVNWTFWIYPGAAESEGVAKVGLKQYIVETILHFQKYSEYEVFAASLNLFPKFELFFFVILLNTST